MIDIKKKGAILHDYMAVKEGGAQVACQLASLLDWKLITSLVSKEMNPKDDWQNLTLDTLGRDPRTRYLRPLVTLNRWRRFKSNYETLLYSGNYCSLAAPNHPNTRNIFYCHSPSRFLFDQYEHFLTEVPTIYRPIYHRFLEKYRKQYIDSINSMDTILVNSLAVQRRVSNFLGKPSTIIYPPCDVDSFSYADDEGYYLSTARLDPLKRIDLVINAFKMMPEKRLIIASDGNERKNLEHLASGSNNITFVGMISDDKLKNLISKCIATIYIPILEDFGISPVESMAAGKPVIGAAEGGLLETVVHNETGFLLPPTFIAEQICDAVNILTREASKSMREACYLRSKKFDVKTFFAQINDILNT